MRCLAYVAVDITGVAMDTGSGYVVPFDAEAYDIGSWHTGSSSKLIVPQGVTYIRAWAGAVSPSTVTSGVGYTISITINGVAKVVHVTAPTTLTRRTEVALPITAVVAGDEIELLLTAGDASVDIRKNETWLCVESVHPLFSGAHVTKSSNQNGNFTTATAITWDTETYDNGGWFTVASPTRFTVPSGVDYVRLTGCSRDINGAASDWTQIHINKNGAVLSPAFAGIRTTAHNLAMQSGIIPVTAGDYFELIFTNEADTNSDVTASTSFFAIEKVDGTGFSGAMVTKAADQTSANYSAGATVAFDSETYDVGGWHDNATNNTRLTVPSGVSRVIVHACVGLTLLGTSDATTFRIQKNGAFFVGIPQTFQEGSASMFFLANSGVLEVTAGDYFELFLDTESDPSVTVQANRTFFSIFAAPDDGALNYNSSGTGTGAFIGQGVAAGTDTTLSATGTGIALFIGTRIEPSVLNALARIDAVFEGLGTVPPPPPQIAAGGFFAGLSGPTWKTWWDEQKAWEDKETLRLSGVRESATYKRLERKWRMLEDSREWATNKRELERRIKEIRRQLDAMESRRR